jgi:hypothetical protein
MPSRDVAAKRILQPSESRKLVDQNLTEETVARIFELVMPEEFGRQRIRKLKHPDLHRAISEMKNMPVGRGVKLKCSGTIHDAARKQKAAVAIANRSNVPIRTMLRNGWLFLERIKDRRG